MKMTCPKCGGEVGVLETRMTNKNGFPRRRRVCFRCGYRFSTYEIDSDTYNTLLKISRDIGYVRSNVQYLLRKLDNYVVVPGEEEDDD